jgi:hypothetical protein
MTLALGSLNPGGVTGSWALFGVIARTLSGKDAFARICRLAVKGDELRGVVALRIIW